MNKTSVEFNKQLELDVLLNGLTEVTQDYVNHFDLNFTEVIIPEGVTSIGDYAFQLCKSLKSVKIGNSLISIVERAFEYCNNLKSITIPDSVTTIGNSAFYMCDSLSSLTIPANVINIEPWAFYACKRLTNITFEGRTMDEVQDMLCYPWGTSPEKISVQVP